jgi:hypothetical protein
MGEREKKPKGKQEDGLREKKPKGEHDEPDVVAHVLVHRNDEADELGLREKKPK